MTLTEKLSHISAVGHWLAGLDCNDWDDFGERYGFSMALKWRFGKQKRPPEGDL